MLSAGQVVDRYTVLGELGSGGMATVFKVRHNSLGSLHALKLLKVQSPVIRQRLMAEGRTQATLHHPNIVTVTDIVEVDGASGLVMEFIDGPSLEAWLRENRPSFAEAERLFLGILAGVARAHRHGLVHRDLKPGNVLLDEGDDGLVPKVTDFGLVKALADDEAASQTRSGVAMGTPAYMSPEQVRNAKNVDQRTDIFALGCILYELVCGEQAFSGDDTFSILNAVVTGDYRPPERIVEGVPERVRAAIAGCLKVNRDDRIPDCAQLRRALAGEVTVSRPVAAGATLAGDLGVETETSMAAVAKQAGTWADEAQPAQESEADLSLDRIDDVPGPPPVPSAVARTRLPQSPVSSPPTLSGTLAGEWFGGPEAPKPVPKKSAAWLLPVLGLVGVGGIVATVLAVAVVAWSTSSSEPAATIAAPTPELKTAEASSAAPAAPVEKTLEPEPVPIESAPAKTTAAPSKHAVQVEARKESASVPATSTATVAPAPVPTATTTTPAVSATAEPSPVDDEPPTGTVRITGDARRVVLQRAGARLSPGAVSPGVYEVRADFDGNPDVDAGRVTVRAGTTVTLDCNSAYLMCRQVK